MAKEIYLRLLSDPSISAVRIQVRLGWAKMEKRRRWQNLPGTCMLVDGALGNTIQQEKWANDAN